MSFVLSERELPVELTEAQAVDAAYGAELTEIANTLHRGRACLVECDKDLTPFAYVALRDRLRHHGLATVFVDGRLPANVPAPGLIAAMLAQVREAVRGPVERRVLVLPHCDLLTATPAGLTPEAREVIPLLHENPRLVCLGFKDPSLPLPRAIEGLFPYRTALLGVARSRLRHLVCRSESRKFGEPLRLLAVHKYVSGINAVRLRKLLATLDGQDLPPEIGPVIRQLRTATLTGGLSVPDVDLDRDVGGYAAVKQALRDEVLAVQEQRERDNSPEELVRLDELLPRGILLSGSGTGKRLIARALASRLGAALLVTSGAELKSRFLGGSEENLRQVFLRARQASPAVILFEQLDSFAGGRPATDSAAAVEQSMLNQLLTELDRLGGEELVIVIGTTERVERVSPALRRPGRLELCLDVPYPDPDDRREILRIHDRRLNLQMTPDALERAVERTAGRGPRRYGGVELQALCRTLARRRTRAGRTDATTEDIDAVCGAENGKENLPHSS